MALQFEIMPVTPFRQNCTLLWDDESGQAVLTDVGGDVAHVLQETAKRQLQLQAVWLTHGHLDHAGGAGSMMAAFPGARLVVHPRGVRHMAEPARLVAGVSAVYGEEYVRRVYGEIVPVPAGRIIAAPDGHVVSLVGRELLCIETPGHARHHICIVDRRTGGIFSGDLFGLSYREHDVAGRAFIFPTTTPTQFEPEAMHASIDRLVSFHPEAIYLTHYSRVRDVAALAGDLHRRLAAIVAIAEEGVAGSGEQRHGALKDELTRYLLAELRAHGCPLPEGRALEIWEADLELDAQGLEVWLDSREPA